MKQFEEAVSCVLVSILSHRYEHLTEMLADVEVDIFRPWVQNATKKRKDTVGRGAEEEVVGWCTATVLHRARLRYV